MRSMKQILTALAFGFVAMLAAPFASAEHYRSNDRYYDDSYSSSYNDGRYDNRYESYYDDRRYDDRRYRRSRNNAALGVALAIGATALVLSHDNGYRGNRGYYRSHHRGYRGNGYRHNGYRRYGRGW